VDKSGWLIPGSLCIDRGVPGLTTDDLHGRKRPRGVGYDIGADEYGSEGATKPDAVRE
jgi:hypothetical protein